MASELMHSEEAAKRLATALAPHDAEITPRGDPARHAAADALERALATLSPPTEAGRVALIVTRGADHARQTWGRVDLAPGQPMPGDRWDPANKYGDENQLTLMNVEVARLIANGQALTLFGDNLLVDLDISAANLPAGSQIEVGGALLEVTAKPHTGCRQFVQRFGAAATKLAFRADLRPRRMRGVHARVVSRANATAAAAPAEAS